MSGTQVKGGLIGGGGAGAAILAATGFDAVIVGLVALVMIIAGLLLLRVAARRSGQRKEILMSDTPLLDMRSGWAAGPRSRAPRGPFIVLMTLLGIAAMVGANGIQVAEATVSAWATGILTGTETLVVGARRAFYWAVGTPDVHGLRLTAICSIAFLIGPLLLVAAGLAAYGRRFTARRVLGASAICVVAAGAVNVARMGLISWATHRFGRSGFDWTHNLGGSLVSLIGITLTLVLFVYLLSRGATGHASGRVTWTQRV